MNARFEPKCILRRLIGQRNDLARFAKDIGQSDDGLQRSVLSSFPPLKHVQARFEPLFLKAPSRALTKLVRRGFGPGFENKRKHLCICEEVSVAFALNGLMVADRLLNFWFLLY